MEKRLFKNIRLAPIEFHFQAMHFEIIHILLKNGDVTCETHSRPTVKDIILMINYKQQQQ